MLAKYPSIHALREGCESTLKEYFKAATSHGGRGLVAAYDQAHEALTASACLSFLDQYTRPDGTLNRAGLQAEVGLRSNQKKYLTRAIHDGARVILATQDEEARLATLRAAQADTEPKPEKKPTKK